MLSSHSYVSLQTLQFYTANFLNSLADEVFASDATFTINKRLIQGRDGIVNWRRVAASGNTVKVSSYSCNAERKGSPRTRLVSILFRRSTLWMDTEVKC